MAREKIIKILEDLLRLPAETEIIEFKKAEYGFDLDKIGQYFSALSNEANLRDKEYGWLVFGVNDKTHQIVGSNFRNSIPALDKVKKEIADNINGRLTFIEIYAFIYEGKRVIMFQIPRAPKGIPISYRGHYYGRDGESLVALNLQKLERIRSQDIRIDWSCQIIPEADISDLDPEAIKLARELYIAKYTDCKEEVDSWDDITFLNKAKITIKGQITNAAIILLGKPESEAWISPAESKIRWILKDADGKERDYLIVSCPMILAVNIVYKKIRNLKYRYIDTNLQTLFPEEIDTYEPYVIREALNNAIAHQDYTLSGRINVIEYDDRLVFTNKGSFIPGSIEPVLADDAPEEVYRNPFLAQAMVNVKMVDTIGSGIRKMFDFQRKRLFPLPDYNFEDNRVTVTITGKILDMNYANILAQNVSLSLLDIWLLNKVQLCKPLTKDEITHLRKQKLIEGRQPNIYIGKQIAQTIGQKIEYSKVKGLNDHYYCDLLITALTDHRILTKREIVDLLFNKLPDRLNAKQKSSKIQNLLTKMKCEGKIENVSSGRQSSWRLKKAEK